MIGSIEPFEDRDVTLSATTASALSEANLPIQVYEATSQRIFGEFRQGGTVAQLTSVTTTEAIANALVLKFDGTVRSGSIMMYDATRRLE